ncbi:MAG: type II secretion system major pseudopilin GspG [Deltaproteobacteria bacterium]|nr:type II secretion system major pseudopilin GspG [Deltaproteobacteria bacterium]
MSSLPPLDRASDPPGDPIADPIADQEPRRRRRSAGFTLIEIMAVVLIMGLLMGLVGVNVFRQVDVARATAAGAKIAQIESALEFYRMDNSKYPEDLDALIRKPANAKNYPPGGYLKKSEALRDPWENSFVYANPGTNNPHAVDISSSGPDEVAGNEDDIKNWSEQDRQE